MIWKTQWREEFVLFGQISQRHMFIEEGTFEQGS